MMDPALVAGHGIGRRFARSVSEFLAIDAIVGRVARAYETQEGPGWIADAVNDPSARISLDAADAVVEAFRGLAYPMRFLETLRAEMDPLIASDRVLVQTPVLDEVDAVLESYIARLESFDPATADHSRAVSGWCRRIARYLGLSQSEELHLGRCGLVHDIGKIETPEAILHAPRALTENEWAIMRDHVVAGHRIVQATRELGAFSVSVRHHHERIDGRGYPDGLKGLQIPVEVRIVSVADAFNAMIGVRPYRAPFLPTTAIEELHRHRDTQFDAELVDAMTAVASSPEPLSESVAA